MTNLQKFLEECKGELSKAEADGSFQLRVNTWLTAGDGRQFCAQAPDTIGKLIEVVEELSGALRWYAVWEQAHTALKRADEIVGGADE